MINGLSITYDEELGLLMEQMKQKEKEMKVLKIHTHKVWEDKKGVWRTYIYNESFAKNRQMIVKRTYQELIEFLYLTYYQDGNQTIGSFYGEYIAYRELHVKSHNTIHREEAFVRKYYMDSPIWHIRLCDVRLIDIEDFASSLILDNHMDRKQFYNSFVTLRKLLTLAFRRGYIDANPCDSFRVDTSLFYNSSDSIKKEDAQVFQADEIQQVVDLALEDFISTKKNVCLCVACNFYMGLRCDELLALRRDSYDTKAHTITIDRIYILDRQRNAKGEWHVVGHHIDRRTKNQSSQRVIPLPPVACNLLDMAIDNLDPDDVLIFGGISPSTLDYRIRKYCRKLGLTPKGNHKIRKTFLSLLLDSRKLSLQQIMQISGHSNVQTLLSYYGFDVSRDDIHQRLADSLECSIV